MPGAFALRIVSPEGRAWEGQATYLQALSYHGSLGILARHAPLVAVLRAGPLHFEDEQGVRRQVEISGGVLKVGANQVSVLADEILSGPREPRA